MSTVTKVNGEPPFKEPELIVLTLEEAKQIAMALSGRATEDEILEASDSLWEKIDLVVEKSNGQE